LATGSFHAERILTGSQLIALDIPFLRYVEAQVTDLNPDGETLMLSVSAQAVKGGTSLCQIRSTILGRATSYLTYP
jgi:hypothetical protein